jgi:hypothetical protein
MKILLTGAIMCLCSLSPLYAMDGGSIVRDNVYFSSGRIVAYTQRTPTKQVYVQRFQNKTRERFRGHEFDINDLGSMNNFSDDASTKALWIALHRQYQSSNQTIKPSNRTITSY